MKTFDDKISSEKKFSPKDYNESNLGSRFQNSLDKVNSTRESLKKKLKKNLVDGKKLYGCFFC